MIDAWRTRVDRARQYLGWSEQPSTVRNHVGGTELAFAAPVDQLFIATEINEWALCASLAEREPTQTAVLHAALLAEAETPANDPPVIDQAAALARFVRLAAREASPLLRSLLQQAAARDLGHVLDETHLTLGAGAGSRSYVLAALPDVAEVPWRDLHNIPTAIVTGSNGKTTTVRLLAACARAQGWRTAYNCTDGVYLDDEVLASGDYSGPAGTRLVMRDARAQAAILEAARGGILRRGVAVSRTDAAIVTNVSADHFGEYGIHTLEDLADVKLTIARVIAPGGLLVLNADDATLPERARGAIARLGAQQVAWFAADDAHRTLEAHRAHGGATCGVAAGHLRVSHGGADFDLGPIAGMPLAVDGIAHYNVANLSGAALGALALGIEAATIAAVFADFGSRAHDNPGRLMRFEWRGATVLVDYAHNPDGLKGLLGVAEHLRTATGRLGLLLGQAGNRQNADMEAIARTAAAFRPQLIVIKENETQLRGRQPGEVPNIIRDALLRLSFTESMLPMLDSELAAAQHALDWARPGDVLVLPLHGRAARTAVVALLKSPAAGG